MPDKGVRTHPVGVRTPLVRQNTVLTHLLGMEEVGEVRPRLWTIAGGLSSEVDDGSGSGGSLPSLGQGARTLVSCWSGLRTALWVMLGKNTRIMLGRYLFGCYFGEIHFWSGDIIYITEVIILWGYVGEIRIGVILGRYTLKLCWRNRLWSHTWNIHLSIVLG